MKTELLVGVIGLGLCTGLLILNSSSVTTKSKKIDACNPQNNAKVQVKGVVKEVSEGETGHLLVTITDGTNGCEVLVEGNKWQLTKLRKLGNRVSFDGIIHNDIVTNIKNIQENVYGVADANGNLGKTYTVSFKSFDDRNIIWNRETIGIVIPNSDVGFTAPRAMASRLRWNQRNTFVYDENFNILSINGEPGE